MEFYTWIKFVHVLGAMAFFACVLMAHFTAGELRTAKRERFSSVLIRLERVDRFIMPLALILLATGLYLAATSWGFTTAWIDLSLALFILDALSVNLLEKPRLKMLAGSSATLGEKVSDPTLWRLMSAGLGGLVALVYLMTLKPGWTAGVVGAVICILLGFAFGGRAGVRSPSAVAPAVQVKQEEQEA